MKTIINIIIGIFKFVLCLVVVGGGMLLMSMLFKWLIVIIAGLHWGWYIPIAVLLWFGLQFILPVSKHLLLAFPAGLIIRYPQWALYAFVFLLGVIAFPMVIETWHAIPQEVWSTKDYIITALFTVILAIWYYNVAMGVVKDMVIKELLKEKYPRLYNLHDEDEQQ